MLATGIGEFGHGERRRQLNRNCSFEHESCAWYLSADGVITAAANRADQNTASAIASTLPPQKILIVPTSNVQPSPAGNPTAPTNVGRTFDGILKATVPNSASGAVSSPVMQSKRDEDIAQMRKLVTSSITSSGKDLQESTEMLKLFGKPEFAFSAEMFMNKRLPAVPQVPDAETRVRSLAQELLLLADKYVEHDNNGNGKFEPNGVTPLVIPSNRANFNSIIKIYMQLVKRVLEPLQDNLSRQRGQSGLEIQRRQNSTENPQMASPKPGTEQVPAGTADATPSSAIDQPTK